MAAAHGRHSSLLIARPTVTKPLPRQEQSTYGALKSLPCLKRVDYRRRTDTQAEKPMQISETSHHFDIVVPDSLYVRVSRTNPRAYEVVASDGEVVAAEVPDFNTAQLFARAPDVDWILERIPTDVIKAWAY